jgi:ribosomal protein L11 methyltransferase
MDLTVEPLAARDWVSENLKAFPPIAVAGFWIHGGHTRAPDATLTPIVIDTGPAFGSGEHATTEGCLVAIDDLAGKRTVGRALDMGCGSGILAIAMVKRWPDAIVLGVDNDPPSVRFAREAAVANGVAGTVRIVEGDGYLAPEVAELGPFDMIAANILSRPLIAMAPDLARHLAPGGNAILSGLLVDQAARVIAAHEDLGLDLTGRRDLRGWATLVMAKNG